MPKRRVVPDFLTDSWKLLQKHYFNYIDIGGSHAEYINVNGLTDEEGASLLKAYKAHTAKRKKS